MELPFPQKRTSGVVLKTEERSIVPYGCRSTRTWSRRGTEAMRSTVFGVVTLPRTLLRLMKAFLIYKMAIELDPEFAIAYARLSGVH